MSDTRRVHTTLPEARIRELDTLARERGLTRTAALALAVDRLLTDWRKDQAK